MWKNTGKAHKHFRICISRRRTFPSETFYSLSIRSLFLKEIFKPSQEDNLRSRIFKQVVFHQHPTTVDLSRMSHEL